METPRKMLLTVHYGIISMGLIRVNPTARIDMLLNQLINRGNSILANWHNLFCCSLSAETFLTEPGPLFWCLSQ